MAKRFKAPEDQAWRGLTQFENFLAMAFGKHQAARLCVQATTPRQFTFLLTF